MKTRSELGSATVLATLFLAACAAAPTAATAEDGYLAVAGQNKTVELLRLADFSKVASIDVSPMTYPFLTFLPRSRRLYVYDLFTTSFNTVLDFGACSGGLLRPLGIPNPNFVRANGDETQLLIGSMASAYGGASQNAVYLVDPSTDTVTGLLQGSTNTGAVYPMDAKFDPDRNELFVWVTENFLKVYDSNLTLLRQCSGLEGDGGTAVVAGKIYVPNGGQLDVWDAVSCDHLRAVQLPGLGGIGLRTRAGDKVYIPTWMNVEKTGLNGVSVIDTATDTVSSMPLGSELNSSSMVLSADESRAYVAMDLAAGGGELAVVDLQSGAVQGYPLDTTPTSWWGLALVDRLGFTCGDGVVESACGEQCDPPGSIVNGSVCDLNCTTGCGNGIVSGAEQCDDGNTNNNDACKNDCTPNVCGDGFVYRAVEQCDHGSLNGTPGDACSATCTLPPRTASGELAAGGTLTTDIEGDGATAGAPVETWVTSPLAGSVSITEGGPDPTSPSGYAFLGYSVHVTVPSSTAENPIILVFEIHSSLLPAGSDQTAVEMSKNGVLVADCDGGTSAASPDPCIANRALTANGNLRVSIRSSTASYWGGVAPAHDARVVPRRQIALHIPANKLSVTTKALIRVQNMDRAKTGQKRSIRIQLSVTNLDCPLGLVADVPDFYPRQPFSQDAVTLAPRHTGLARLRLVASRFAFPADHSPRQCTIKLSAAAQVADNVDPNLADNTTTVQITVTTR